MVDQRRKWQLKLRKVGDWYRVNRGTGPSVQRPSILFPNPSNLSSIPFKFLSTNSLLLFKLPSTFLKISSISKCLSPIPLNLDSNSPKSVSKLLALECKELRVLNLESKVGVKGNKDSSLGWSVESEVKREMVVGSESKDEEVLNEEGSLDVELDFESVEVVGIGSSPNFRRASWTLESSVAKTLTLLEIASKCLGWVKSRSWCSNFESVGSRGLGRGEDCEENGGKRGGGTCVESKRNLFQIS